MLEKQSYIPNIMLRQTKAGAFKIRLSVQTNPKYSRQRIQLGLGTRNRNEAEKLSIAICKILMACRICSQEFIKMSHEFESPEFCTLQRTQTLMEVSGSMTGALDPHEYPYQITVNKGKPSPSGLIVIHAGKPGHPLTEERVEKILKVLSKIGSYILPPVEFNRLALCSEMKTPAFNESFTVKI